MAGDSVCGEKGPLGSGAWIGALGRWRPSQASCGYQNGHNGPHSWEGRPLQPKPKETR